MSIKAVVVARPLKTDDLFFIKDDSGYLFPKVLQRLERTGLIHSPTISLPASTPDQVRAIVEDWGFECIYSSSELPQHRLKDVLDNDASETFLVLTPYAYLLVEDTLAQAREVFADGEYDLVCFDNMPAYSHFVFASRACLRQLSEINDIAVTPFVFSRYAPKSASKAELSLSDDWFSAFNFLVKVLYAGEGAVPIGPVRQFFANTPDTALFSRNSYTKWLCDEFLISDFEKFVRDLADTLSPKDLSSTAGQLHFLKRLLPHMPERRTSFLELGFGTQPISSMLLLNCFKNGVALEPFADYSEPWPLVEIISEHIGQLFEIDLSRTRDTTNLKRQLEVAGSDIHSIGVPEGSVDLIFSKTVLEHVMDIRPFSQRMFKLLAPGGVMYHVIDHSDHVDVQTIRLDFLEHDPETWAEMQAHTNLLRVNDFVDIWQDIGFEIKVHERHSLADWTKPIHPCWDSYSKEDLLCYSSVLIARKPE